MFFGPGHAAEEPTGQLNYAFASYLGTGIYTTSGRSAQIYNLPFKIGLYESKKEQTRIYLTLPVAVGFVDFKALDIVDKGLPTEVATGSFIPGLRLEHRLTDNWTLAPKADCGPAKNFTTGETVYVYSFELVSRLKFALSVQAVSLDARILYAKHGGSSESGADDFSSFEAALGFPSPFLVGKKVELTPYIAIFRYFNDLTFLRPGEEPVRIGIQNEVGLTFRVAIPLMGEKKRTIGIGYRFGDNLDVFRLIFGTVI